MDKTKFKGSDAEVFYNALLLSNGDLQIARLFIDSMNILEQERAKAAGEQEM